MRHEVVDRLGVAVVEYFEILLREPVDEVAVGVVHDDIDVYNAAGDLKSGCGGAKRGWRLGKRECGNEQQSERATSDSQEGHDFLQYRRAPNGDMRAHSKCYRRRVVFENRIQTIWEDAARGFRGRIKGCFVRRMWNGAGMKKMQPWAKGSLVVLGLAMCWTVMHAQKQEDVTGAAESEPIAGANAPA